MDRPYSICDVPLALSKRADAVFCSCRCKQRHTWYRRRELMAAGRTALGL